MKHIRVLQAFVLPDRDLPAYHEALESRYGRQDLKISVDAPRHAPQLLEHESMSSLQLAAPELIRTALAAENEGVNGIVVDCMADPSLEVMREAVSVPVLGPGHTSMYAAAMLGQRFSLLVTTPYSRRYMLQHVRRAGLSDCFASCRAVDTPPSEIDKNRDRTVERLAEAAKAAVVEDGADTVVLACTGFSYLIDDISTCLKESGIDVPVVDPLGVTISVVSALIDANLSHSRLAYPASGIAPE